MSHGRLREQRQQADINQSIEELKGLLEQITPGEWYHNRMLLEQLVTGVDSQRICSLTGHVGQDAIADARFIALTRNALPSILAHIDRQAAEIERIYALIDSAALNYEVEGRTLNNAPDIRMVAVAHLEAIRWLREQALAPKEAQDAPSAIPCESCDRTQFKLANDGAYYCVSCGGVYDHATD